MLQTIDFLTARWGITRDQAYSVVVLAGYLRVTQVVDGVKGAHMAIRKDCFRGAPRGDAYREHVERSEADAADRADMDTADRRALTP